MAKETKRRGTSKRQSGSESRNPGKERKQPTGGGIPRDEERSHVGGKGYISQQSDSGTEGEPSRQTSTAEDELGQV